MKDIIERLYDEIYGPKLTPYELLKNVKLPNYISVDFKNENNFIIGTSKCHLPDGEIATFIYTFDNNDNLLSLISEVDSKTEELYNREKAIEKYYSLAQETIYPDTAVI
ncbi:hypothetical protein [Pseudobacillus badius]|uniref:hypothetical protein n=1 Tax=Bacillus badius TaxID=1455 RepID=UPI001CBE96DD|nr:hypothetical protein [Bacillus badius]UAT28942.1 hypothetical protein K7T73_09865 [Bacillus badius]GLY12675.1 hypothetical protein Bbad01_38910 [Bacillus badius]